jgi:predicted acyltransferase
MPQNSTKSPRLLSLDALRGFDMFWITGGEEIFHVLAEVSGWTLAAGIAHQLVHPDWNGFRAYDLIFPLFLFLAGVSTPFSLGSRLAKGDSRAALLHKVLTRGLVLVLLGIVYNNGLQLKPLAEIRFPSVLGRIGLAGMLAQIIYLYTNIRTQYYWFVGILVGYWAFVMLVPVPDCGAGLMTIECNPVSYLDKTILPGHLHRVIHDPEGLVSTIPAVATALLGIFTGNLLQSSDTPAQKVQKMLLTGGGLLVLGWLLDFVFPINKNLWTSSFVLWVGGWSLLLLAVFYWVIDVQSWHRWAWVLAVIGTNSILIYVAQNFIDFSFTANALFGGFFQLFPESIQKVGHPIAYVVVEWLMLWFLYKQKVFLKV